MFNQISHRAGRVIHALGERLGKWTKTEGFGKF